MSRLSGVRFLDSGGVILEYMDLRMDVRNGGLLVAAHQLQIAEGPAYDDGIAEVLEAGERLLADALEDFTSTDPVVPRDDDDDRDEDEA